MANLAAQATFEGLSNANLNGQAGGVGFSGNWTVSSGTTFAVQATTAYEGGQAVQCTNPTGQNVYRALSTAVSGDFVVYVAVRRSSTSAGSLIFSLRDTGATGGNSRAKFTMNSSGNIILGDGGSTTTLLAGYSADTWYVIRLTGNTSTNNLTAAYSTGSYGGGGTFSSESSAVTMVNSGDIGNVMLDGDSGTVNNFFDLITPTNPLTARSTPAVVGTPTSVNTGNGSISLTYPTGAAAVGNTFVAVVSGDSTSTGFGTPSGWVKWQEIARGSTGPVAAFYTKVSDGTESGSVSFTYAGLGNHSGFMTCFSGLDLIQPVAASNSQSNGSSTTVTAPSIVAPYAGQIILLAGAWESAGGSDTASSYATATSSPTFTEIAEACQTNSGLAGAYGSRSATTATGSGTFTISTAHFNVGIMASLSPGAQAAASGPANLKSLDGNVKANIKSYNGNLIANVKSISGNS